MVLLRFPQITAQLFSVASAPQMSSAKPFLSHGGSILGDTATSALSDNTYVISTAYPLAEHDSSQPPFLIQKQHETLFHLPEQELNLLPLEHAHTNILSKVLPALSMQFRTACNLPQNPIGLVQFDSNKKLLPNQQLPEHVATFNVPFQDALQALSTQGEYTCTRTTNEDNMHYVLKLRLPHEYNTAQYNTNQLMCTTGLATVLQYQQQLQAVHGHQLRTIPQMVHVAQQGRMQRTAATQAACKRMFGKDTEGTVNWNLKCTRLCENLYMDMAQCSEMRQAAVKENPLPHVFDATMSMAGMLLHVAQQSGSTDVSSMHTYAALNQWLHTSSDAEVRERYKQCTKEIVIGQTSYMADPKIERVIQQDSLRKDPAGGYLMHMHVETHAAAGPGEDQEFAGGYQAGTSLLNVSLNEKLRGIRVGDCEDTAAVLATYCGVIVFRSMRSCRWTLDAVVINLRTRSQIDDASRLMTRLRSRPQIDYYSV